MNAAIDRQMYNCHSIAKIAKRQRVKMSEDNKLYVNSKIWHSKKYFEYYKKKQFCDIVLLMADKTR